MSINAKGTPAPINIDALPGTPSLGFTSATHSVSASSFINTHVDASVPSLSLTSINASANNNVNVTNSIPNLSISGLDADVVGIPELNDVDVTASSPSLLLTPSNPTVVGLPDTHYTDILSEQVGFATEYNGGAGVTGGAAHGLFEVSNTNDSGTGSFRQAAIDAENAGGGWIWFSVSGAINLSSPVRPGPNTTIDGRGQNIQINNSGQAGDGAINIRNPNVIVMYVKVDSGGLHDISDAIRCTVGYDGVWVHHCSFTGQGDDQFSFHNTGGIAEHGYITVSWCHFSDSSSVGPFLFNGARPINNAIRTKVTLHHNDISTGDRGPFSRQARVHQYNNYMHDWDSLAYSTHVNDSQCYFENNYCDGTTQAGKWSTQDTAGTFYPTGNTLVGGATFGATSTIGEVFTPPYAWTPDVANTAMRDAIIAGAGWQNVPFPS